MTTETEVDTVERHINYKWVMSPLGNRNLKYLLKKKHETINKILVIAMVFLTIGYNRSCLFLLPKKTLTEKLIFLLLAG